MLVFLERFSDVVCKLERKLISLELDNDFPCKNLVACESLILQAGMQMIFFVKTFTGFMLRTDIVNSWINSLQKTELFAQRLSKNGDVVSKLKLTDERSVFGQRVFHSTFVSSTIHKMFSFFYLGISPSEYFDFICLLENNSQESRED